MSKRFIAVLVIIGLTVFGLMIFDSGGLQAEVRQPHMKSALEHLEKAKAQLEKAAPSKHRAKALELVSAAIAEVRQGMEAEPGPGPRRR